VSNAGLVFGVDALRPSKRRHPLPRGADLL
jgi:hypothetical protein